MRAIFVHRNQAKLHFQQVYLMELNGKQNKIGKEMWIIVIWTIWNHRIGTMLFLGKKI